MSSANEDLYAAQRLLREHIAELTANGELVNVHCYAIDNLTKISEQNIEAECDKLIKAVREAKNRLLRDFRESSKVQLSVARRSYISISNEKRLCTDLNNEITTVIRDEEKEEVQGDRIKKLCQQIKETCTKRTEYQQNNNLGPNAGEIKQKLFEIATRHLGEMSVALSNIMGQQPVVETPKKYRLKLKGQVVNEAGDDSKDEEKSPPRNARITKLKRHYIVRGSQGVPRSPGIIESGGQSGSSAASDDSVYATSGSSECKSPETAANSPNSPKSKKNKKGKYERPTIVVGYKVSEKQKAWRRRQILIGQKSEGYRNLIQMHPGYMKGNPSRTLKRKSYPALIYPPDVEENIGKKRWSGKYRQWRLFLHGFTKNADVDPATIPQQF